MSADRPEVPPVTGQPDVDAALAEVGDLSRLPLSEHLDRLTAAHEALERTLHPADPGRT